MSRILESTVQEVALNFLKKYYQNYSFSEKIFAQTEVRTKKKYGSKRADGVIVFRHWLLGTYVVSMEAKSYKTLPAMKPRRDNALFLYNAFLAGVAISILSGAFFSFFKMNDGFWQIILPLNVFVLGALAYAFATSKSFKHKIIDVVAQVKQYPAHVKWLAFSQDSLTALPIEKVKSMERICRVHGIGVVVVKNKSRAEILVKPKFKFNFWRDNVRFYSKEKDIRATLK
ncbi:MAG: hypothetical protein MK226_10755 [Saprospiraceae bacterium]|nr:hypothetical protein [Saprospiraceae bacterium]